MYNLKTVTSYEHTFTNSREWIVMHLDCGHNRTVTAESVTWPDGTVVDGVRCWDCEDAAA